MWNIYCIIYISSLYIYKQWLNRMLQKVMELLIAHKLFSDCMSVMHDCRMVFAKKDSGENILPCSKLFIQHNNQQKKEIFYTTTTFTPRIVFTPKRSSTNPSGKLIQFVGGAVDFVENHLITKCGEIRWRCLC